jgi:hypothetical protein
MKIKIMPGKTSRIEACSDGVFAIAITSLMLDIYCLLITFTRYLPIKDGKSG